MLIVSLLYIITEVFTGMHCLYIQIVTEIYTKLYTFSALCYKDGQMPNNSITS